VEPDVEFVNVSKIFNGFVAVDNISFSVPRGSFFSLLGPSGCGKSTTLRMTSGFEQPDAGELRIAGQDMVGVPAYRRPTNMVFQRWALFPHMTVAENVAFGLQVERVPRREIGQRVKSALELVALSDFAARKPGQLSGGQMQRVALARALVKRPKVLLLDEPLGALDLKLRTQMQLELKRIQQEVGTTFIYVTHDQGEAMTMSDKIAVMNKGRIEQIGSPRDIYDRPATRFVAGFIGNANIFPVEIAEGAGEISRAAIGGVSFDVPRQADSKTGAAHASLRYERIRIGTSAAALPAKLKGSVRDVIFAGSAVQYVISIPSGPLELTAQAPYEGGEPLKAAGDAIDVGWELSAPRIFFEE
jgi:spermidine/putrescine transport system ATP-binding protein